MPLCEFSTNLPSDKVPENFERQLSELLADILSKPIERISVTVMAGSRMSRGGTSDPTCLLNMWSIGVFDEEKNSKYSAKLYPFIHETLGVDFERIGILYQDIKPFQVGKHC